MAGSLREVMTRETLMENELSKDEGRGERPAAGSRRFHVRAGSVNAVRRALYRAPGGARVVGRFDRETIECMHTMDEHSLFRHWPVLVSRLQKAGLAVVSRPGKAAEEAPANQNTSTSVITGHGGIPM